MNVYDTANRLAGEIKNSEEYMNFKMARQAINLNNTLKEKMKEFDKVRYETQIIAMQTGKKDEEQGKEFVDGLATSQIGYGSPVEGLFVYQHKPSDKVGEAGSYSLEITTENYLTHAMDSYSADLIVQVVAVGN